MKAIFSFYSKSYLALDSSFNNAEQQFKSAVLAVVLAKKHFGRVELVTDTTGTKLFQPLETLFDDVSTALDDLPNYRADLWTVGKLKAYQIQTEPFCHLDFDAFLFDPLPPRVLKSRIFTQGRESLSDISKQKAYYRIEEICQNFPFVPPCWLWALERSGNRQLACNVGIYGTNSLALNAEYCKQVFAMLDSPLNRQAFETTGCLMHFNISLEQFTLAALCRQHGIQMEYLLADANCVDMTRGYVHLLGTAKREALKMEWMEQKFLEYAPEYSEQVAETAHLFTEMKVGTMA